MERKAEEVEQKRHAQGFISLLRGLVTSEKEGKEGGGVLSKEGKCRRLVVHG